MKKNQHIFNFVAEVGCNHQGDLKFAFKMIDKLVDFCGVKFVKFQKKKPYGIIRKRKI